MFCKRILPATIISCLFIVLLNPLNAAAQISGPSLVDFGEVAVGGIGIQQIELYNGGNETIIIDPSAVVFCDGFSMNQNNGNPITIFPGLTQFATLYYRPLDFPQHTCEITLGDGLLTVQLSGSGKPGTLAFHTYADTVNLYAAVGEVDTRLAFLYNDGDIILAHDPQFTAPGGVFSLLHPESGEIWPDTRRTYRIDFAPTVDQTYNGVLHTGIDLPDILLIGHVLRPYPALQVTPGTLVFPPTNPGEQSTVSFSVENVGNVLLGATPYPESALLETVVSIGNGIWPGETAYYELAYSPLEFGQFSGTIQLGQAADGQYVDWVGPPRFGFAADENRVSVFFDAGLSTNELTITPDPQPVTAYLALSNATDTSGIAGWQCRIEPSAGASLLGATVAGGMFDAASDILEFSVSGGASPLPFQPSVLLATLDLLVWDTSVSDVSISVLAGSSPAIPGLMTWTPAAVDASPIPMPTATGESAVAWIHLRNAPSAVQPDEVPVATRLLNNVPNPFNPTTDIRFVLEKASEVRLTVYDLSGRRVRVLADGFRAAGPQHQVWDGRDDGGRTLSSGAYYVQMVAGQQVDRRKVMLIK